MTHLQIELAELFGKIGPQKDVANGLLAMKCNQIGLSPPPNNGQQFWSNCSDLTGPHPKWEGNSQRNPYFVNYYHLASEGKSQSPTTHVMIVIVFEVTITGSGVKATHQSQLPLLFAPLMFGSWKMCIKAFHESDNLRNFSAAKL